MRKDVLALVWRLSVYLLCVTAPAYSQTPVREKSQPISDSQIQELDISPEIMNNSPVLQRWRRKVPNVLQDIQKDPSFTTRLRLGYSLFPSTGNASGLYLGVEDIFIGRSGLTVSGDYQVALNGKRETVGANVNYYLRPLGSYVNVAPLAGYRYFQTGNYSTDGVNLGVKLILVLSRGGAADISITQSWISPGSEDEVGLTKLSFGYAVSPHLRLSTDIQKQNSRQDKGSSVGVILEWML
ncbi:MAG: hypothetical protein QNJ51_23165 [Calothrix sp. MO_167.B12]|nr:hypothetical protein [Calothrix sp. MO_167.B12]